MDAEQAETYLRLAAESALRSADRAAGREAASLRMVRAVAEAFTGVGALPAEVAERVVDGLQAAIIARSPATTAPPRWFAHSPRTHGSPTRRRWIGGVRPFAGGGPVTVTPVGQRLIAGRKESDVGIYLLALVSSPAEMVLSTVIRLLRPGQGAPFDLDAVDPAGRAYHLRFAGGGSAGTWLTGEFVVVPRPPEGTAWLDVSYGMRTVRVGLPGSGGSPAGPPPAPVTVTPVRLSPGEAYLRARADAWLSMSMPEEARDLAATVPALTAIGALPSSSDLPAKIAALARREAASLPDQWADALAASDSSAAPATGRLAAAHLTAALPPVDGLTVVLTSLTSGAWSTLHGAALADGEAPAGGRPACWIRDWTDGVAGPWRPVSVGPWDWPRELAGVTFYPTLSPAIPAAASSAEVLVTGRTAEARAMVPLTWWLR